VAVTTYFADIEKRNFSLMHCWNILKDEPKWIELKRNMDDKPQSSSIEDAATQDSNSSTMRIDLEVFPLSSSTRKCPMERDAAKAERKKVKLASHDYAAKMHELPIEKISLFKESEAEWKVRLDEMVNIEKLKVEKAMEHCKMMIDLKKKKGWSWIRSSYKLRLRRKRRKRMSAFWSSSLINVNPTNATTMKHCKKKSSRS
jgi:hypothetical protein